MHVVGYGCSNCYIIAVIMRMMREREWDDTALDVYLVKKKGRKGKKLLMLIQLSYPL